MLWGWWVKAKRKVILWNFWMFLTYEIWLDVFLWNSVHFSILYGNYIVIIVQIVHKFLLNEIMHDFNENVLFKSMFLLGFHTECIFFTNTIFLQRVHTVFVAMDRWCSLSDELWQVFNMFKKASLSFKDFQVKDVIQNYVII